MSCLVWNARGLGSTGAFQEFKRLLAVTSPSLVFVSETKLARDRCSWWKGAVGMKEMFVVEAKGKSGGLFLMWDDTCDVSIKSFSDGHIDCVIRRKEEMWRFTGIYGNPPTEKRKFTWELLRRLATQEFGVDMGWLMGGDFNEITCDAEKMGGGPRPLSQMTAFNEVLMYCGMHESATTDRGFTWKGRRGGENILERLDRLVGNRQWMDMFPNAVFRNIDFYGSDHRPVWGVLDEKGTKLVNKGRGRFHFEDKWFMEKTFVPDVLCEWRHLDGKGDFSKKLGLCGKFLSEWARSRCNVNGKTIEKMRKERMEIMARVG